MAVAQGFSKITTSGSVFMYDTADGVNSFKGKPATNILQGITPGQSTSPPLFVVSYGTESVYIPGLGKSVTSNYCNIYNDYNGGSGACCPSLFNFGSGFTGGVTGSTTYTYQIIYRTTDGYYSENYMYRYEYGPSGYITEGGFLSPSRIENLGDGWVHGWGTFTTNAATTNLYCYLFHYQYATQNKVQVAGIMLTQGSQVLRPNQFLAPQASRSNTQSLLPLLGNTSLNVSDASFSSSGSLYFDGTNDFVDITNNFGTVSQYTIEHVSYKGSESRMPIAGRTATNFYQYGDNSWAYTHGGVWGEYYYPKTVTINGWGHWTIVYDGSYVKIYRNGVFEGQQASSGTADFSNGFRVGYWSAGGGYAWNGEIAAVKIYTRALTPGEITNNFNHYKTKYNLS
jgi:hypothetical protein